jgi:hypothetical protein
VGAAGQHQQRVPPTSKTRLFAIAPDRHAELAGGRGGGPALSGRSRTLPGPGLRAAGGRPRRPGVSPAGRAWPILPPGRAVRRRCARDGHGDTASRLDGAPRSGLLDLFEQTFEHCRSAAAPRPFPARSGGRPGGAWWRGGESVMSRVLGEARRTGR